MVKEGSIVIDVGLTKVQDKLVGDVDTESVAKVAKAVTPVPGGVGITTVYSLIENVVEIAENRKGKR
jgi:methylenetetrahydrofolate dehydrogenase (NADP+)/methenyltetrahydrofolate cyclohydrolase